MEELTIRLPVETRSALESEAAERGVPVGTHVRDIVDAYRAGRGEQPTVSVQYIYSCQGGDELERLDTTDGETEEIGSFSYGSRSVSP